MEFVFPHGTQLTRLLATLARSGHQGQIVGAHGTGKSTLLVTLTAYFRRQKILIREVRTTERRRSKLLEALWACRRKRGIVIVDSFEQLGAVERDAFVWLARALRSGLLVTCHQECQLPVIWRTEVNAPLAKRIVERLTRQDADCVPLAQRHLEMRLARLGGDMRETLFELYDVYRDSFVNGAHGSQPSGLVCTERLESVSWRGGTASSAGGT